MRNSAFSHRLRQLRGERSKADFARFLGVTAPSYQKYEDGMVPRANCLSAMCDRAGVSVRWILGGPMENTANERAAVHAALAPSALSVRESSPPPYSKSDQPPNHPAPCRYPADCDLVRELADLRTGMAEMKLQMQTVVGLLGAALGDGLSADKKRVG